MFMPVASREPGSGGKHRSYDDEDRFYEKRP
jgi:hypothetical protein